MSLAEVISLVASIASVILAIVAIWLSIVFYQLSSQLSESTKEAAKGIGSSVERLEKLFDKLYSDTFTMMRDTVTDMRKHIWPEVTHEDEKASEEVEEKAEQKIQVLIEEYQKQLSEILQRQRITDEKVSGVTKELGRVMEKAIDQSRKVEIEAGEEAIQENIIRTIISSSRMNNRVTADKIYDSLSQKYPGYKIIRILRNMERENIVSFDTKELEPSTIIELKKRK